MRPSRLFSISFCATETTREPGINNIAVNTDVDKGVRFATDSYNHDYTDAESNKVMRMHNKYEFYKIKKYSLLARGGMEYKDYNDLVTNDALTADDIAKVNRQRRMHQRKKQKKEITDQIIIKRKIMVRKISVRISSRD